MKVYMSISGGECLVTFATCKITTDHFTANVTSQVHYCEKVEEIKNKIEYDLYHVVASDYDNFEDTNKKRIAIRTEIEAITYKMINIDRFWSLYEKR